MALISVAARHAAPRAKVGYSTVVGSREVDFVLGGPDPSRKRSQNINIGAIAATRTVAQVDVGQFIEASAASEP